MSQLRSLTRYNYTSGGCANVWQRFTERARRVVFFAQEEAGRLGENYVSTEHLLLGLVRESDSVAARILETLGVSASRVRTEIERQVTKGDGRTGPDMQLTPRAKRVIDLAYDEARQLNNNYIGTEHLLLGLIRENDGLAGRVLAKFGVDLDRTRREVRRLQDQEPATAGTRTGASTAAPSRSNSRTPALDEYGRDYTVMAKEDKLDPVVGRSAEIERVVQILSRRTKNNPVLVGEPGVGKTAIAEGLAMRIIEGDVPEILADKRIVALDMPGLVAGTKYRGEFEERMKRVMEEVRRSDGQIVLFIDELHTLVGAGAAEGAIDASNIMKPALSRGELQCIGATTRDEYRKYIERDAALARRFQMVKIEQPSVEEAVEILKGLRSRYESHHKVEITDHALEAASRLSDRYITDRFLPDKAIDLIDEASSRVRLRAATAPQPLRDARHELADIERQLVVVAEQSDFDRATFLEEQKGFLTTRIADLQAQWEEKRASIPLIVGEDEIAQIVTSWTGIPVSRLVETETQKLLQMESALHKRVISQDEAIIAVSKAVRRARSGMKDPRRPMGSFLFVGPTGTGKTELAKALAAFLFEKEDALVRIDMSEYMERFAVSRLVGAPPGYVGFEDGGQLTEVIRRNPYSVILLDEVEKAHPEVFNLLLQVMEDGRLTDSQGRVVDFRHCVLIMTSNIGSQHINREPSIGLRKDVLQGVTAAEHSAMKERIQEDIKRVFRPEFINRLDDIIVFQSLTAKEIRLIVDLMLSSVRKQVVQQGMTLLVQDAVIDRLALVGFDPQYGARPLRRAVQRLVEDPLSDEVLLGRFTSGDTIEAVLDGEGETAVVVFRKVEDNAIEESSEGSEPLRIEATEQG